MMSALFFAKVSIVLTVLYAGLNVHQLTSTHAYISEKVERFRAALAGSDGNPALVRLNLVFYVVLPLAYLAVLKVSEMKTGALCALAAKFACTAVMDIRSERRILAGGDYTPFHHAISRIDNTANLAAAASILYLLFRPAG
jgi:hypothetical protein